MGYKEILSCVAIVAASMGTAFAADQATFYVAPNGNDSNKGTEDAPFKTITAAQKAVRAVNGTMTGDIVVYLREGTYQLSNTVNFTEEDGGKDGHYVRYKAYPGETPLVTGGMPITGWTIHDQEKNIWKVEGVDSRFRQIYVNGKKGIRARMPNLMDNGDHNFFRLNKVDSSGVSFLVNNSDIGEANWNNLNKVEIHLMIAWSESIMRLNKATKQGNVTNLDVQNPEKGKITRRKYPMLGTAFMSNPPKQQVYYLENAYEFIDQPGEWYLDETEHVLYYKAREGESMSTAHVVVPRINTLFSVLGKSSKSKVGYMSFENIVFAHSNYLRPSDEGFLDLQAGMFNIDVLEENGTLGSNKFLLWRPDAGFRVENAHHMNVKGCVFTQMAATGLDFVSGTNDDVIEGNVFYEIGAGGIMLGKFSADSTTEIHIPYNPSDMDEVSTRDTIRNNLITNVTNEHQGAVGIGAGYPRDVVIEHNEVSYANYSGISVGFGWTKSKTAMNNNHINWNNIHHVARLLCDSGPIYTLSNQGESGEIQHNYLHDISQSKWSDYWVLPIYLDEGTSGFTIKENVYKDAPAGVGQNQAGSNTLQQDGSYYSADVVNNAGPTGDFKALSEKINSIPLADFSNAVPQAPFVDGQVLPGLIQAENYDEGGQGISFNDKDFVNEGKVYREDGVDVVGLECADTLNTVDCKGYAVGYTNAGEWMEYTVNVVTASKFMFRANVASGLEGSGFRLFVDGKAVTDTIVIPQGEDWVTYVPVDGETSEIAAGEHVLRVAITGAYANIDWIKFALSTEELMVYPRNVAYNINMDISNHTQFNVFDVRGQRLGTIRTMDAATTSAVIQQMYVQGFGKGIYFVQSADKKFGKLVQVK